MAKRQPKEKQPETYDEWLVWEKRNWQWCKKAETEEYIENNDIDKEPARDSGIYYVMMKFPDAGTQWTAAYYGGVSRVGETIGYAWQTFRDLKLHPDSDFTAIGKRIFLTPDAFDSPAK